MTRWLSILTLFISTTCAAQEPAEPEPKETPAAEKPDTEAVRDPAPDPAVESPPQEAAESKPEKSPEAPWIRVTPKLGGAGKPIRGPKDELAVFGVGDSDWQRATDGREWLPDDDELLFKILNRFPRFGRASMEAWRKTGFTWKDVVEKSAELRGDVFPLSGRLTEIEQVDLIPELVDRFEMDFYYRLHVTVPGSETKFILFVRELPPAWKELRGKVDFEIGIDAIYLKHGKAEDSDATTIYLVGLRPGWYPQQPDAAQGVAPVHVLLAKHGFDVGLLGDLKGTDRLPFARFDQEPFYQALAAIGAAAPADFKAIDFEPVDLAKLFSKSDDERLHGVTVKAMVRRVIKVRITEEELLQRFGRDHYYQMDIFLPLGDQPVKLGKDTKDGKAPVFYNDFPATMCVLELPPDLKEGEDIHKGITASTLFYRIWSYGTEFVSQANPKMQQQSPMFLARTVHVVPDPKLTFSYVDMAAVGGVLLVLAMFGGGLYFFSRESNRKAAEERGQHLPDRIEVP